MGDDRSCCQRQGPLTADRGNIEVLVVVEHRLPGIVPKACPNRNPCPSIMWQVLTVAHMKALARTGHKVRAFDSSYNAY